MPDHEISLDVKEIAGKVLGGSHYIHDSGVEFRPKTVKKPDKVRHDDGQKATGVTHAKTPAKSICERDVDGCPRRKCFSKRCVNGAFVISALSLTATSDIATRFFIPSEELTQKWKKNSEFIGMLRGRELHQLHRKKIRIELHVVVVLVLDFPYLCQEIID
jgi:hypothetical protein